MTITIWDTESREVLRLICIIVVTLLFAVLPVPGTLADEGFYKCQILHIYNLDDDGALGSSNLMTKAIGDGFTVSRISGAVTGSSLTTVLSSETKVLERGSTENSFRSVAFFETAAGTKAQLLEVKEFRAEKDKPFVAMSMGGAGVVTGTCE